MLSWKIAPSRIEEKWDNKMWKYGNFNIVNFKEFKVLWRCQRDFKIIPVVKYYWILMTCIFYARKWLDFNMLIKKGIPKKMFLNCKLPHFLWVTKNYSVHPDLCVFFSHNELAALNSSSDKYHQDIMK